MSTKTKYGCPRCGSVGPFEETSSVLIDQEFPGFDAEATQIPEYSEGEIDWDCCETVEGNCFRCMECLGRFAEPAEIVKGKPVEGTGVIQDELGSASQNLPGKEVG